MKKSYLYLSVSVLFAIGAIYIASKGMEGWGWFMVCSLLTFELPSEKYTDDDKE